MNKYAQLNKRQSDYIKKSTRSWFNVAEGGKRGGKNVINGLAFCIRLENHPDFLHLVAGNTVSNAMLNIIDCNGYGIMNYFDGRCKEGKYQEKNCLYVNTSKGQKVILISGGGKAGDNRKIQGNTYGLAYITEANNCHKDFLQEVFDRTISSNDRGIYHDFNPKSPQHFYYEDIEEFHKQQQENNIDYGYNYSHFNIYDNLSISNDKLKTILNSYDKNSIWYKRDILGQRIATEGIIYELFANNNDNYIIKKDHELIKQVTYANVGIDFGGNKSGHAFNLTGFTRDNKIITLDEYYTKDKIDAEQLNNKFVEFVDKNRKRYNIHNIYCDSAEQVLIRGFKNALLKSKIGIPVRNATKGSIIDRIRFYNLMIANNKYFIVDHCKNTIAAFNTAMWKDNNKGIDERLDDGTINIDSLDAQEYSTEKEQNMLIRFLR